ncbi:FAD/NAD(P)-binding domain-containing protein [Hanseniaspora valbyensis NRRL Y-1626]|uniref:FAD/NAD(P)-binding domain-containing protein n=1 Tax=Hanseniaspora valbyensis NRRL Y-1626 TaxID=766949 RepID=A0A1B7TF27_9ASCO|nr:FAD/NAD(P)-binding domain-containing protein [Hanseniaspora valbyensis NRRL Y-1626]
MTAITTSTKNISSSALSKDLKPIKKVLVVGSGPTGISVLKAFTKENKFGLIKVYEKRHDFGGLWNYVKPIINNDSVESVPLTDPSQRINVLKTTTNDSFREHVFDSAVYKNLDTNVPKFLMEYNNFPFPEGTPLFPKKDTVLKYLIDFAETNRNEVTFDTEVTSITYDADTEKYRAKILKYPFQDVEKNSKWDGEEYDAVVIASGNYDLPFIPHKKGLKEWFDKYTDSITHSKNFDSPEQFENVKGEIVIVGNSASGSDIAFQLATHFKDKNIYQTVRRESGLPAPKSDKIIKVSDIDYLDYENKSIKFLNGTVVPNVEKIIFCTGFLKSFPFLDESTIKPFVDFNNGKNVKPLFNHIIPVDLPTLAFIGLPKFVLPTRLSETQASWLARVWTGRIQLPSKDVQREYHDWFVETNADNASLHDLNFPFDVQYSQRLNREIRQAKQANKGYFGLEWNGYNIKLRSSIKTLKEAYVRYLFDTGKRAQTVEELIEHGYFEWPESATTCVQVPTFAP